ncbi:hypothetical protein Golax_008455 [Gossypium laxum]|uniref:Uncharacterized protein n=1 Tax=Gossypium laxum TaxID=34288 RepID=A0A7J9ABG5_9ROSI|nr:hypothetical protein [Gossypium laxum]
MLVYLMLSLILLQNHLHSSIGKSTFNPSPTALFCLPGLSRLEMQKQVHAVGLGSIAKVTAFTESILRAMA